MLHIVKEECRLSICCWFLCWKFRTKIKQKKAIPTFSPNTIPCSLHTSWWFVLHSGALVKSHLTSLTNFDWIATFLEDWNIVVDFGAMLLSNTFRYPDNVTTLLFFQLEICIKYTEVELLNECIHVQFDLQTNEEQIH